VTLGSFSDPQVKVATLGLVLTAVLMARRIRGAILLGIFLTTAAGIWRGLGEWPRHWVSLPYPSGTLFKLDFAGAVRLGLLEVIFAFFFVDLFDNVGTLVGVCEQGGFMRDGNLPRAGRALLADAVGTMFGALTGTSTVTSYIESAAGVAAGARTGLGNLLIAALFLAALFISPLVSAIPSYATAPVLILVGTLMCQSVARIQWNDFSEAFPAFMTMLATPLTFSVATGLSLGLIAYTLVKIGAGKYREISPLIWILTILFLLRYAYLAVE
jgi:AGZA family xanthine/uracil permease-like MFS transporter